MMRIMFVDDEPNILSGLRRILRPLREEWDMVFVESGQQALESLDEAPFDIIVSDMKMPGMDGAQLLSEIQHRFPESIRIALSGETDSHMIYRCVQHAHQYLSKPCDADTLVATVKRAYALKNLMKDEQLRKLVSNLSSLPSLPAQYESIMQELQSEDPSLLKIGEIIESDVAMSAKILQLVNSAFFGLVRHVSSPIEASKFLGLDVIKSLVLTTGVFSQFDESSIGEARLQAIWSHASQVGILAKQIAVQQTTHKLLGDYALMGALLADVGKLVFAVNLGEELARAEKIAADEHRSDWEVERELIGHSHMDVGAFLLGLWGLPNPVVECVAFHHVPAECVEEDFSPLTAVHIAHAIVSVDGHEDLPGLDREYIGKMGAAERLPEWLKLYEKLFITDVEAAVNG
ncbi:MAG: response regulator [Gammaproteobacteria bacterium]|nr:response regulator [Gammaproteobacteria bacterium]